MLSPLTVETSKPRQFVDVTAHVEAIVHTAAVADGICVVYSPHTTAAITINENADPDVVADLLKAYTDLLGDETRFRHAEGNSGGHALTSLVGASVALPVHNAGWLSAAGKPFTFANSTGRASARFRFR